MFGFYLPRVGDFFPNLRRGHGTTHPYARINKNGVQTRERCACVNQGCELHKRTGGDPHEDQGANVKDWKDEHGVHKDRPLEECFR